MIRLHPEESEQPPERWPGRRQPGHRLHSTHIPSKPVLGFKPCAEVYLIPFNAKRARGALRVDLPNPGLIAPYDTPHPTREALAWMAEVLGLVSFAERVAIIIHTDGLFAGRSGAPSYYGLATMLAYSLHRLNIDTVIDPVLRAAEGYAELTTVLVTPLPLTVTTEHPEHPTEPLPTIKEGRASRENRYPTDKAEREAWRKAVTNA